MLSSAVTTLYFSNFQKKKTQKKPHPNQQPHNAIFASPLRLVDGWTNPVRLEKI